MKIYTPAELRAEADRWELLHEIENEPEQRLAAMLRQAAEDREKLQQSEYFLDLSRKEHLAAEAERDRLRRVVSDLRNWLDSHERLHDNEIRKACFHVALAELDRLADGHGDPRA